MFRKLLEHTLRLLARFYLYSYFYLKHIPALSKNTIMWMPYPTLNSTQLSKTRN